LHKELYQLLLETQEKLIESVTVGQTLQGLQTLTRTWLAQGLIDLEVFHGSLESVMNDSLQKCYMHGVGHHLGLDVHDCGAHPSTKEVALQEGMVITIEPGLYFSPHLFPDCSYSGLALRIEDDIVVTKNGLSLVLTGLAPKSLAEVCGDAL
jgi:Xaa-Pro aminopeptidase